MHIEPKAYKGYEICILSGQVDQAEAVRLMELNPEFKAWYLARRKAKELVNG
jgi:hypothetical protein